MHARLQIEPSKRAGFGLHVQRNRGNCYSEERRKRYPNYDRHDRGSEGLLQDEEMVVFKGTKEEGGMEAKWLAVSGTVV